MKAEELIAMDPSEYYICILITAVINKIVWQITSSSIASLNFWFLIRHALKTNSRDWKRWLRYWRLLLLQCILKRLPLNIICWLYNLLCHFLFIFALSIAYSWWRWRHFLLWFFMLVIIVFSIYDCVSILILRHFTVNKISFQDWIICECFFWLLFNCACLSSIHLFFFGSLICYFLQSLIKVSHKIIQT